MEKRKLWSPMACFVAFVVVVCAQPAWCHPEIFSDLSYKDAQARAQKEGKLLIVDFTASWCGPCKKMDRDTWSADSVKSWLKNKAIAIQVDVDKEKQVAQSLRISAMPTVIVFRPKDKGKEFDRKRGYQAPGELVAWLDMVQKGKTSIDLMMDKYNAVKGKGGKEEVTVRYKMARQLMGKGDHSKAADEFVWLWKSIPTQYPPMAGVRMSFMVSSMKRLASMSPDAKAKFTELRDESESKDRLEWEVLNEVLGDSDKTIGWFDGLKTDEEKRKAFKELQPVFTKLLISKNRWKDIGKFGISNPVEKLTKLHEKIDEVNKQIKERFKGKVPRGMHFDPFPSEAGIVYASLLAAGRDKEAKAVYDHCLKLRDTEQMRKVLKSAKAKVDPAQSTQ